MFVLLGLSAGSIYAQGTLNFGSGSQSYGTDQDYGTDQGYGTNQGYGTGGQQQGQPKGQVGLERRNLTDSMKVTEHTTLSKEEECKTKCNMNFSNCYRLKNDRGACYKEQQDCLGKCGGSQEAGFGEDSSGGEYGF